MVYGNMVGPNATIGDFYPGYAMWQSGVYPPYGAPSLYWGDNWNYWLPLALNAKKNLQDKKAHVQKKLEGVEFLEDTDIKKLDLKKELADVDEELSAVDIKCTELMAKSKDSESEVEVVDMSTGAKDAVNEADVESNADESSSPLGLSGEEGEGELDGFDSDSQESEGMPPAQYPRDATPDFAVPREAMFAVGSQETDQMAAMSSAQMSNLGLASQGLTGGMTSDMFQATNQGMAAASDLNSGLAETIEDSYLSGDHPIIPDKYLGEAIKIGYDPERDQAWRDRIPADILAKVDANVQKAKEAAELVN